jgi:hypothetical protein
MTTCVAVKGRNVLVVFSVVCVFLLSSDGTNADDQQNFYKSYPACYGQAKKSEWASKWSEADIVQFCTGATLKQMVFGVDTFAFDAANRKRVVYLDEINEEAEEHDTWMLGPAKDLYDGNLFFHRRSSNLRNAFATIIDGHRYIVADPVWLSSYDGRQIVWFHEVGHHACRHTEGQ